MARPRYSHRGKAAPSWDSSLPLRRRVSSDAVSCRSALANQRGRTARQHRDTRDPVTACRLLAGLEPLPVGAVRRNPIVWRPSTTAPAIWPAGQRRRGPEAGVGGVAGGVEGDMPRATDSPATEQKGQACADSSGISCCGLGAGHWPSPAAFSPHARDDGDGGHPRPGSGQPLRPGGQAPRRQGRGRRAGPKGGCSERFFDQRSGHWGGS